MRITHYGLVLLASGVFPFAAGCAEEDPIAEDTQGIEDDLKRGRCKGNQRPCDAGADANSNADAGQAIDAARPFDATANVDAATPAPVCTSFTYSAYGACQPNNTQTRTAISSSPAGCMGGTPILSQACVYTPPPPPTCTSFGYSAFGPCQPNNTQTRSVVSSLPEGCTGGTPVLGQACTYIPPIVTCTSFTYSAYGACQPNNTQTRTVLSSSPAGCTGGTPGTTQACTYTPPTCASFVYSDFGPCQPNNTQTRTVISSSPAGCMGGTPALGQACVYMPPAAKDYKTFDGSSLTANRAAGQAGVDRRRIKPFTALQSELPRVLGNTPAGLAGASNTFGAPPARWFEEPRASAVGLQKSLDVAFDGCLTYTATAASFAAAPTATSALAECTTMARRFWSRTPEIAEVSGCVTVATTSTTSEPDARRRWAYACTSLLISTPFLTY